MKCNDAIQEYKTYLLVENGVSHNTLDDYMRDICHFTNYVS